MAKTTSDSARAKVQAPEQSDTAAYGHTEQRPDSSGAPERRHPRLPHERDESARATGNRLDEDAPPSDRKITQAAEDVEDGLVDTERRGIPNDIPGGKGNRNSR